MNLSTYRVVLVRPQIPENVGFVARNMKAFGFHDLCLIEPEFTWNPQCAVYKTACGSHEIVDNTQIFKSIEDSIREFHHVIGFSRRIFDVAAPAQNIEDWINDEIFHQPNNHTALLFGSENFGLDRQAVRLCSRIVTIPQYDSQLSLNVSHAVCIVLYELFKKDNVLESKQLEDESELDPTMINQHQIQLLADTIEKLNITKHQYDTEKYVRQRDILMNFIQRTHITKDEFSVLMGFINKSD